MEQELSTDICVIGGGPAGSTIALRLSKLGNQVIVLEKEIFPRPHVGICLSDPTNVLLDYLGVGKAIKQEAFAQRKITAVKWGSDKPTLSEQPGSHVDRGRFDQILIQNAVDSGVQLLQPARSYAVFRKQNGGWKIKANYRGKMITISARFLVEASGRSNTFPGKRIRFGSPLFALHAIWKLRSIPNFDGFMEAGKNAWLWAARLNDNQAMISLYTDPKYISINGVRDFKKFYSSSLENFSLVKLLERKEVLSKVHGCDASSRYSLNPVGADFIRVGDANFTVDPMASQGVHLALSSAIQAAIVVNTLIHYPKHAKVAQSFYRNRQQERINQFKEQTASEYGKVVIAQPYSFWQDRAHSGVAKAKAQIANTAPLTVTQKFRVCPHAKIISIPVMKERWIELAPALHHPALSRPVAFLGGKNLDLLFHHFKNEQTIPKILDSWKDLVPGSLGTQIIQWLWEKNVLVAVATTNS